MFSKFFNNVDLLYAEKGKKSSESHPNFVPLARSFSPPNLFFQESIQVDIFQQIQKSIRKTTLFNIMPVEHITLQKVKDPFQYNLMM